MQRRRLVLSYTLFPPSVLATFSYLVIFYFCRNVEVYYANFKALQGHWCFRWLLFECSMLQVATFSLVMLHGKQINDLVVATLSDHWASSWRLDFRAMDMVLTLLSSDSWNVCKIKVCNFRSKSLSIFKFTYLRNLLQHCLYYRSFLKISSRIHHHSSFNLFLHETICAPHNVASKASKFQIQFQIQFYFFLWQMCSLIQDLVLHH